MKCHRHPETDAVAVCKHCAQALCLECAQIDDAGASCGGPCAEWVALQHSLLQRSREALQTAHKGMRAACHLLLLSGLVMASFGFLAPQGFAALMGVAFLLAAAAGYAMTRDKSG